MNTVCDARTNLRHIQHTVEVRSYMRYKVVAVDINGGKDQTSHEHNQAKRQAAQAIEGRLFGPQRQDQLILILENTTEILILQMGTEKHFQAASI